MSLLERKSNWSEEEVLFIYNRTGGLCRHCKQPLVLKNRTHGKRGAWHIDHGKSIHDKGSNDLHNMWALCAKHNLDKSTENGAAYNKQFKNGTLKGKLIDSANAAFAEDFLWSGSKGFKNNERRVKK
jgi:5-methylcytosine-specific restriction endonuclease McrA